MPGMPKTAFNGGFKWLAGILGVVLMTAGTAAVSNTIANTKQIAVLITKVDALQTTMNEVRTDVKQIERSMP